VVLSAGDIWKKRGKRRRLPEGEIKDWEKIEADE
jgi:hypothetical protein